MAPPQRYVVVLEENDGYLRVDIVDAFSSKDAVQKAMAFMSVTAIQNIKTARVGHLEGMPTERLPTVEVRW